ncbi:ankyrin repeat and LEM domain-containing protein 2 homolog isoform X2 [Condylostylus longicornis]|uniref:ankyrin repeat and LEM domain-containing protein 2 homolog isoform X2 n=1 Tax=Condylostylus longicornis TaxID=2530218 RepID=UPI00244DF4FB|nr:ankyrin repeat and LEM domain-containing protein 2 homolog isoform X2 [Condylostylus longicornis]
MEATTYYSIFIPSQVDNSDGYVFTEKEEALKILKGYKDGRLKSFKNKDDAIKYSQTGHEVVIQKFPDLKSPSATAEKAAFFAPTKQERISFRKAIEDGDYNKVNETIWKNPRYLVNVGDTPTSLKDGYRYNALHICAIHKKAEIADLILQTISTISFVELLHGKKNTKVCQEVCEILLDYYLNMPEKGRSETPLHLAVKYGAVEVVEVLTTYSQCKMIPNLENLLPKDIICDRINDAPLELKEKIANLLQERFYVPVIRSVDGTVAPSVGQPFSPTNLPDLNMDPLSPELEIQAYAGPMSKEQAKSFRRRWKTPPRSSNCSPSRSLNVCFSPHKIKLLASTPRKLFNSPINTNPTARTLFNSDNDDVIVSEDNQNGNFVDHNYAKSLSQQIEHNNDIENNNGTNLNENLQELNKIVETVTLSNSNNALQFNSLNKFALTPLLKKNPAKKDMFFKYREKADSPIVLFDNFNDSTQSNDSDCGLNNTTLPDSLLALTERHVKLTDTEKGLEMIGRELAKEQNVEWKEYWDFLGVFVDIASPEGLDKLEQHLKLRKKIINEKTASDAVKTNEKMARNEKELMHLCNELHKLGLIKDKSNINQATQKNHLINPNTFGLSGGGNDQNSVTVNGLNENKSANSNQQTTTPYLCVEKSLQVFAKRCTKTILHNIKNVVSIHDAFLSELKRLKSLICSFKDDIRFLEVDFTYVHSRFANLIVSYLKNSHDTDNNILLEIRQCFEQIIQSKMKVIDKNFLNSIPIIDKKEQLQCVSEFLLKFLKNEEPKILPENLKTEKICADTWANEYHCECQWETVLSRQASRKKRHDSHSDASRKLFNDLNTNENTDDNKGYPNSNITNTENSWRKSQNESFSSNDSSENDLNDSDDDIFYSDFGSDEDNDFNFYTPPDSPTMLELDVSDIHDYNVYLLGNEPTKRDLDVLNAIFHIDISKEKYPNIYNWRAAILKHPNEERDKIKLQRNKISNNFKRPLKDLIFHHHQLS